VDKIVDKSRVLVDKMWISHDLSTGWSFPQIFPQVYPQILPLLSTTLSTASHPQRTSDQEVVHDMNELSTASVDKFADLWIVFTLVVHNGSPACGRIVDRIRLKCL
jgi:hypothetical protein